MTVKKSDVYRLKSKDIAEAVAISEVIIDQKLKQDFLKEEKLRVFFSELDPRILKPDKPKTHCTADIVWAILYLYKENGWDVEPVFYDHGSYFSFR